MTGIKKADLAAREAQLSAKQKRWAQNMANWDGVSYGTVVMTYTPPPSVELTPCGCAACDGCPECKEIYTS
jgi:hypothetical protein